jgi:hypothetical protein
MNYREFLAGLEPVIIGLDNAALSLDRDGFWAVFKDARRVLSSKYVLARVADNYFDVEASFSVGIESSHDEEPVTRPLRIVCVFSGHFHTSRSVDREHAQKFIETEAFLVFWPYFRQFVADTTARMAIPPVTVPLALGPGEHSYRRRSTPPKEIAQSKATKTTSKRLRTPNK